METEVPKDVLAMFVRAAHEKYHEDGEVEVDIPTRDKLHEHVSTRSLADVVAEGGMYVKSWVWARTEDLSAEDAAAFSKYKEVRIEV